MSQVQKLIGKGAFGEVYSLETPSEDMPLCMKKVSLSNDNLSIERAIAEAKNWKLLNHPNIVKLVSWNLESQFFCIIMERVNGITLRNLLEDHQKRDKELKESMVLKIFTQLVLH
jgi:serine/threonine protein kinase